MKKIILGILLLTFSFMIYPGSKTFGTGRVSPETRKRIDASFKWARARRAQWKQEQIAALQAHEEQKLIWSCAKVAWKHPWQVATVGLFTGLFGYVAYGIWRDSQEKTNPQDIDKK